MFLECKLCGNPNIEFNRNILIKQIAPFVCPQCGNYLRIDEVKQWKSVATHYTNNNYRSVLVTDIPLER